MGSDNRTYSLEPQRPSERTSAIIHQSSDVWTIPPMYEWFIHTLEWSYIGSYIGGGKVHASEPTFGVLRCMNQPYLRCMNGSHTSELWYTNINSVEYVRFYAPHFYCIFEHWHSSSMFVFANADILRRLSLYQLSSVP